MARQPATAPACHLEASVWVNAKDLEAAAKRSQQHADCLKLAASNPSITCK
jgi:hypothetical protein